MSTLSVEEIKSKITPIAKKFDVPVVYLFGSYARKEERDHSDIDLVYYGENSKAVGIEQFHFQEELEQALNKKIDLIRLEDLEDPINMDSSVTQDFFSEKVELYEKE